MVLHFSLLLTLSLLVIVDALSVYNCGIVYYNYDISSYTICPVNVAACVSYYNPNTDTCSCYMSYGSDCIYY